MVLGKRAVSLVPDVLWVNGAAAAGRPLAGCCLAAPDARLRSKAAQP